MYTVPLSVCIDVCESLISQSSSMVVFIVFIIDGRVRGVVVMSSGITDMT
jgi:hypothetical protein